MKKARAKLICCALLAAQALFALSCDETVKPVNLDVVPRAPSDFSSRTEAGSVLLRWNFLSEVSPTVSFSGYLIYLEREGWEDGFQPWGQFETREGSQSFLPLVKRANSLASGHMEVRVVGLQTGFLYSLYAVGVQNGNEGPPSPVIVEAPFRLHDDVVMRDQAEEFPGWYIPGWNEASFIRDDVDRIGYLFDPDREKDYLLFRSIADGGWLRVQKGGDGAGQEDPPTDGAGNPVGFHDDPELDRLELEEGDHFFVLNTGGTPDYPGDDHYSRIRIERVIHYGGTRIIIDCDYQPRANTPIL